MTKRAEPGQSADGDDAAERSRFDAAGDKRQDVWGAVWRDRSKEE
jgi:hypothetical protein